MDDVVLGKRRKGPTDVDPDDGGQFPLVYRARITKVDDGEVFFVIPKIDSDYEFGPAPYERPPAVTGVTGGGSGDLSFDNHTHSLREPNAPPIGTKCAVAFGNGDIDDPMVMAIFGWPG